MNHTNVEKFGYPVDFANPDFKCVQETGRGSLYETIATEDFAESAYEPVGMCPTRPELTGAPASRVRCRRSKSTSTSCTCELRRVCNCRIDFQRRQATQGEDTKVSRPP